MTGEDAELEKTPKLWSKLVTVVKYRNFLPLFLLLLVAYFSLGFYQINNTGLTYDETAHLGAAQSYLQGYGLNAEHPPFLKLSNTLVLFVQAPEYRSFAEEQYNRGKEILLADSSYNFYNLLFWSRWIYLSVNAIFLLFLIYYTCFQHWLSSGFALLSGVLFVFSPSFFSHNFLLTTDTGATVFAALTTLSWFLIVKNHSKLTTKQFYIQTLISAVLMSLALNVKFSNIILLPILAGITAILFYCKLRSRVPEQSGRWLKFGGVHIGLFLALTWLFYTIAFRAVDNVIGPSTDPGSWIPKALSGGRILVHLHPIISFIFEPFYYYFHGLLMVLNRTQDVSQVYYYDNFYSLSFSQFVTRVFWFKENPVLFGFWLFALVLGIASLWENKSSLFSKKIKQILHKQAPAIILISFPLIYWMLSKDSLLTIGFRHFYPILLSLYLFTAWLLNHLLFQFKSIWLKLVSCLVAGLYIFSGLAGSYQGLSYVNIFWTEPKWKLANESTINWCQELEAPLLFLQDAGELRPINENILFTTRGCAFGFAEYARVIVGPNTDINSYQQSVIDRPESVNFQTLNREYLVVDSATFQSLQQSANNGDQQAQVNLDFLESRQPIFERNQIIFVYRTH